MFVVPQGLQHFLMVKEVVGKLEEGMVLVKEKLKKEVVEVKAKADEAKEKALTDLKAKMDIEYSMKLSISTNAAVEKERTKWQAQVNSLEDDKLELESQCETLQKELTEAKADLATTTTKLGKRNTTERTL